MGVIDAAIDDRDPNAITGTALSAKLAPRRGGPDHVVSLRHGPADRMHFADITDPRHCRQRVNIFGASGNENSVYQRVRRAMFRETAPRYFRANRRLRSLDALTLRPAGRARYSFPRRHRNGHWLLLQYHRIAAK